MKEVLGQVHEREKEFVLPEVLNRCEGQFVKEEPQSSSQVVAQEDESVPTGPNKGANKGRAKREPKASAKKAQGKGRELVETIKKQGGVMSASVKKDLDKHFKKLAQIEDLIDKTCG